MTVDPDLGLDLVLIHWSPLYLPNVEPERAHVPKVEGLSDRGGESSVSRTVYGRPGQGDSTVYGRDDPRR